MNIRCRSFERAMWDRVKHHDPRRSMSFGQKVSYYLNSKTTPPLGAFRFLFNFAVAVFLIWNRDSIVNYVSLALAVAALAGFGIAFIQAGLIWNAAGFQTDYSTLWMLPLPVSAIFRTFRSRIILSSLYLLLDFTILYGLIASASAQPQLAWSSAAACAVLQWVFFLSLVGLIAGWCPNRATPLAFLSVATWVLLMLGTVAPSYLPFIKANIRIFDPVAWTNTFFVEGILRGNTSAIWFLFPILLVIGSLYFSYRRIKQLHNVGTFLKVPIRLKPTFDPAHPIFLAKYASEPALRNWNLALKWEQLGIIERYMGRILNTRERVIAETLSIRPIDWSSRIWQFLFYVLLFLLTNLFIERQSLEAIVEHIIKKKHSLIPILLPWGICFILFALMMAKLLNLMIWHNWPEYRKKQDAQPVYLAFRACLINGFRFL